MVNDQSWPQFGASTMMVCSKPSLRSRLIALAVSVAQLATVAALLPYGSLPMLTMTYFSWPTSALLMLSQ